jgi:hypothetical protein
VLQLDNDDSGDPLDKPKAGFVELLDAVHFIDFQLGPPADPELTAAFQNDVIGWRKKEMAALLSRGIARGDVRADVPIEIARELGQSVLWHRLLVTGDPITDDLVVQIVDEVLVPFVAPRSS